MSLVRPHLEYAVQVWNPIQKTDIATLNKIQNKATKIPIELRGKSSAERLKTLSLTTLELRRIRGDLIEMYKIVNGIE